MDLEQNSVLGDELDSLLEDTNIVNQVEQMHGEQFLDTLGGEVVEGYEEDYASVKEFFEDLQRAENLALQQRTQKNEPWENSSNVKHPLLTVASHQFGARAYPALVPGANIVKYKTPHLEVDNPEVTDRGNRIAKHMDYQLTNKMVDWEQDMDNMLSTHLPGVGTAFKKTFYDAFHQSNVSEFVPYNELIINFYAPSMERAYRKTQVLHFNKNEMLERFRSDFFREITLSGPNPMMDTQTLEGMGLHKPADDEDSTPHAVLECHTWADLDNDGYKEPWIIYVHKDTRKVLGIYPRFDQKGIKSDPETGQILRIEPVEYFTPYIFLPHPKSRIYGVGFYTLLGPMVESMNTLINQLIDAGTLNNLQAGFISKNFRVKGGRARFRPGEWKHVPVMGQDIRNGIFPLPTREPSNVLFMLLGFIETGANNVASIKDILLGENPGQNTKATTALAMIEQGLKSFTAIFKRVHKSFSKELIKLYRLNGIFLSDREYFEILGISEQDQQMGGHVGKDDYKDDITVIPVSNPNVATEAQRIAKVQSLLQNYVPLGTVNLEEVTRRGLEAEQHHDIKALMTLAQPQPNFDQQTAIEELRIRKEKQDHDFEIKKMNLQVSILEVLAKVEEGQRSHILEVSKSLADNLRKDIELFSNLSSSEASSGNTSEGNPGVA